MILTVTLNAALDVTYAVEELVPQGSHRVRDASERAGGKGVNAASVLHLLGLAAATTGLLGGTTGARIAADLDARGLAPAFFECADESRRTVNVVSAGDGEATIFNEPGALVTEAEWSRLVDGIPLLLDQTRASVVVLAGSLPRGIPQDAYAVLVTLARAHGARTILDAGGDALRLGVAAGPDIVKPNVAELEAATGETDVARGASALRSAGAHAVVVSAGGDGALAMLDGGELVRARLTSRLSGNPTGAGDALVAALAAGLDAGRDWPTMMAHAVGWSAAAVLQPQAGSVDADDVRRLAADVVVETENVVVETENVVAETEQG